MGGRRILLLHRTHLRARVLDDLGTLRPGRAHSQCANESAGYPFHRIPLISLQPTVRTCPRQRDPDHD